MIHSRTQGSATAVIIATLSIAIIGVLGFAFLNQFNSNNSTEVVADAEGSRVVPNSEAGRSIYTLTDAVGDITTVLADGVCKGGGSQLKENDFITVSNSDQFAYQGGKSLINKELTHAYVQYGCGSQGVVAFVAREDRLNVWLLVHETARMYALCDGIRGYNFPSSIVDKCYVSEDAVEPREWSN